MTRDEIIELAREAGFRAGHIELYNSDPLPFVAPCSATDCLPELERFAALVAAPSVPTSLLVAVANLVAQMEIVSRVGFVDTPNDKDSCAAFCVAEGTWLELMSAVESLASALAAATETKP